MAIYRPRGSRWPGLIVAAVIGLVVGLLAGFLLLGGRPASTEDAAARLRASLDGAAGLLDVAGIEYGEAVVDGQVVADVEYRGSLDALARSRARFLEARPALVILDPEAVAALEGSYDGLDGLMRQPAPVDEVQAALAALALELRGETPP